MTAYHPYLLQFLPLIPHGRVVSYKLLSRLFGVHPRKVASMLMGNTEYDSYPSFKVVHTDGRIGWYGLWVDEKKRRLEAEEIIVRSGKVDRTFFWEPDVSRLFIGFPVADRNIFQDIVSVLKPVLGHSSVLFQSERTPHITVRFVGKLSWPAYARLLEKLRAFDLSAYGGEGFVYCDTFGDFQRQIFYLAPPPDETWYFQEVSERLSEILGLPVESRERIPHVTVFRSSFPLAQETVAEARKQVSGFLLPVSLRKLVLYATIDDRKQIPLVEFGEFKARHYRVLPHVSELRIEVSGATVDDIFFHAGQALASLLSGEAALLGRRNVRGGRETVHMESQEKETLLVDFLNELLGRSQIGKKAYIPETVRIEKGGKGFRLEARIVSRPVPRFIEDIKATTYQDVNLERTGEGWRTKLVFDI